MVGSALIVTIKNRITLEISEDSTTTHNAQH